MFVKHYVFLIASGSSIKCCRFKGFEADRLNGHIYEQLVKHDGDILPFDEMILFLVEELAGKLHDEPEVGAYDDLRNFVEKRMWVIPSDRRFWPFYSKMELFTCDQILLLLRASEKPKVTEEELAESLAKRLSTPGPDGRSPIENAILWCIDLIVDSHMEIAGT